MAHTLHKRFTVISSFSKLLFVFSHFDFFEVCTPVNVHHANRGKHSLNDHFRHGAHSVYKIYSVFKFFSKLQFVLHILTISKFLLR